MHDPQENNLPEEVKNSPLYSEDLAPVPPEQRTWNKWHLAALWVGMAVCIPTYMLASFMIKSGLNWIEALIIIGVANIIITLPMVLNGNAGVKYGLPFPVLGRAAFGIKGIHIASFLRGIVACGWFGVQTWIGGLAIYEIINAITGHSSSPELSLLKFISFFIFWIINMYFIWKGTESIKFLEQYSAPILIVGGLLLIVWGTYEGGGFGNVLKQGEVLKKPSAYFEFRDNDTVLKIQPLMAKGGREFKSTKYNLDILTGEKGTGQNGTIKENLMIPHQGDLFNAINTKKTSAKIEFRRDSYLNSYQSSKIAIQPPAPLSSKIWMYILWLTAMVGFWATMSISIADITRFAKTQKDQVAGQFIGLPGTMMLFSFIGIFVTCASIVAFDDILVGEDAPWDPVSLLARFNQPWVIISGQIFILLATLSTNIAANVIAPAYAFSNMFPKKISFKMGGYITGIIGILICPWWIMDEISGLLIFISGFLGPILGILISDYFLVRKKHIEVNELYLEKGIYNYSNGFNPKAMIALAIGIIIALIGFWVPQLKFLYDLSWFIGFFVSFFVYFLLMRKQVVSQSAR